MIEMNFEQARFNMVEQQIRTWDVLDSGVLDVLLTTPRDNFVPEKYKNLAYSDLAIPLAHEQMMMHPKLEAHLLQALALNKAENVLEIGTGSGCLTAFLAKMAKHVYSIDIFPGFLPTAATRLKNQGITNFTLEEGDGSHGWHEHGPFDAIAITGSVPALTDEFKEALNVGGRLFAIVGEETALKEATLMTRLSKTEWTQKSLLETEIAPLINATLPQSFIF